GLPPGLSIMPNSGVISGTPTTPGTYAASILATDYHGSTLKIPYSLIVNPIGISTLDLPPAQPDKPYSQQLTAAGGKPPYTWSLLAGNSACVGLDQFPSGLGPYDQLLGRAIYDPLTNTLFPGNVIPAFRFDPTLGSQPPPVGDLTADGRLTVPTPPQYDKAFCVQVTDSIGNKAKSALTVISLVPGQLPLSAYISSYANEVSVGDPVFSMIRAFQGTSPYTATALLLPPGFVFYPDQGIVFGYPQTPGIHTLRVQVKDGAGAI